MTTLRAFWRNRTKAEEKAGPKTVAETQTPTTPQPFDLDINPNDPFLSYCLNSKGAIDIDKLLLDSPAVKAMKAAGVKLVVPLVSQGDLIGLINLGPRRSEQEYNSDDVKLLQDLSSQAAPALKVAQLVQQQKEEAAERERIQQELRVARLIQQTLLPQELPQLAGWHLSAYYQPARAVGGDFYDFIYFADGRIALIVADVTDKGVPAALVMATTRSILRAAAEQLEAPGAILERTNNVLVKEIPPKMFVTCFVAILDPETGELRYANAGHDVPYHYTNSGLAELRATGMPLGLMPGMSYEEKETNLAVDDYILLYSDGLVEAHDPQREMFGFPHLKTLLGGHPDATDMTEFLLDELATFTGPDWEQEDDVTLVTVLRQRAPAAQTDGEHLETEQGELIAEFSIASEPGNERQAMNEVAASLSGTLSAPRLEKLKTAVAEATMNGMEHGNGYDPDKPVQIAVYLSGEAVTVTITDHGQVASPESFTTPDLGAKLAGEQSPRGWGLFLIKNMVDDLTISQETGRHTVTLSMNRMPAEV